MGTVASSVSLTEAAGLRTGFFWSWFITKSDYKLDQTIFKGRKGFVFERKNASLYRNPRYGEKSQKWVVYDGQKGKKMRGFIHYRSNRGNATVFYRTNPQYNVLVFGVAYCSPRDSFSKAKGREVAYERFFELEATIVKPNHFLGIREQILGELRKDPNRPSWFDKAFPTR